MSSLIELMPHALDGGRISHYEWPEGEYIVIKDGYWLDEKGLIFTIAPWMITDTDFLGRRIKHDGQNKVNGTTDR